MPPVGTRTTFGQREELDADPVAIPVGQRRPEAQHVVGRERQQADPDPGGERGETPPGARSGAGVRDEHARERQREQRARRAQQRRESRGEPEREPRAGPASQRREAAQRQRRRHRGGRHVGHDRSRPADVQRRERQQQRRGRGARGAADPEPDRPQACDAGQRRGEHHPHARAVLASGEPHGGHEEQREPRRVARGIVAAVQDEAIALARGEVARRFLVLQGIGPRLQVLDVGGQGPADGGAGREGHHEPDPPEPSAHSRICLTRERRGREARLASARRFGYSPIVRPQTVVFVEPPYVCWDRQMDRVREGEEEIPGHRDPDARGGGARSGAPRAHRRRQAHRNARRGRRPRASRRSTPTTSASARRPSRSPTRARIAARVKERVPRAVVTVGGPHVSAVPERTLELFPGFDYGIVGEGERSYLDLIARLASGDDAAADVAGLVYRDGERRARESARALSRRRRARSPAAAGVGSAAGLPAPLPAERLQLPRTRRSRASSRRAAVRSRARSATARRPAGAAASTASSTSCALCRRLADLGVRHILFYDDLFTVSRRRVVELCERFLARGLPLHVELQQPPEPARPRRRCGSCARRLLADRLRHRVGLAARARRREARGEACRACSRRCA